MVKHSRWLWFPGDFEIHQSLIQNFKREERGMGWPAYWYQDDCHRNVSFTRTYELDGLTTFVVHAKGTGYVDINGTKHPLGRILQCGAGKNTISIYVGNMTGLPAIYVEGDVIKSDEGWSASNFVITRPAGSDVLFTELSQDPNLIEYTVERVRPVEEREIENGTLFDFGRAVNGSVELKLNKKTSVTLCYGESETEARDVEWCYYKQEDVNEASSVRKRAFRYIFVPEVTPEMIDLTALHEYVPKRNRAKFKSNNVLINKIWDVSVETLNLCSDVFFIDGIKRDRWIWAGDAYQANFMNQYSYFDEDIDKRTLVALRGQDDIKQHINTIVDYSILWVIGIFNHYKMTGDLNFLKTIYPKMKQMVDYFIAQTNDLGFIYGRENDWIFVDWSEMDKDGTVAAEQILLLEAYQTMVTVGEVLHQETSLYGAKYAQLRENLIAYFWDDERGAFIDTYESGKRHVTRHANIFAVLFDTVDQDKQQSILHNVLLNDQITQLTTPYFKFFEQDAMCKLGQQERVLQVIKDYWGGMLDRGAVTFWEEFDPRQTGAEMYAMYGDVYGKSLCHAWGASPIYLLGRHFIGLRPTEPGYKKFVIRPNLGAFESLHSVMPLKGGHVSIEKEGQNLTVKASKSGGTLEHGNQAWELLPNQALTIKLNN